MAYIRQLKNGKWRAEVQRCGQRPTTVWNTKREAEAWAKRKEAEIMAGIKKPVGHSFSEAVNRYLDEVSSKKRSYRLEALVLPKVKFNKNLSEITSADIATWRDSRLAQVSGATTLRETSILRHLFRVARDEWGWMEQDPLKGVRLPKGNEPRHQRWGWRSIKRVARFLGYQTGQTPNTKSQEVALAFMISLRTGMRAGEVLKVSPDTVRGNVVYLQGTKTERFAQVPLTKHGVRLCGLVSQWTLTSAMLDALFRKARDATLVGDLHFHDARATALTMLAKRVDVLTLSRISRHKNLSLLSNVYYRETAKEIANRLM